MKLKILLLIILAVASTRVFAKDVVDSISIGDEKNLSLPDSIINQLQANLLLIDSLTNQNKTLKSLLKESQKETERVEAELSDMKNLCSDLENIKIKNLEASNDTLQRWLVTVASNFLYIPYEDYSIQKVALPAFLATKGTAAYSRCENRLPLLQNYKADIISIIDFLRNSKAEYEFCVGDNMREGKAMDQLKKLSSLSLYIRYSSYNDWQNTYLGNEILSVQKVLQNPTIETPEKLDKIRNKLEKLLENE